MLSRGYSPQKQTIVVVPGEKEPRGEEKEEKKTEKEKENRNKDVGRRGAGRGKPPSEMTSWLCIVCLGQTTQILS